MKSDKNFTNQDTNASTQEMLMKQKQTAAEEKLFTQNKKAKQKKRIKRIIACAVAVLILFFVVFIIRRAGKKTQFSSIRSSSNDIIRTKVYLDTYTTSVDISGYIQAYETQEVVVRATGAVTGVYVSEGDRVTKGQLLAEIDSTNQTFNLKEIEWQIEKAQITGTTSEKDMQLLQMRLDSAKRQLENTKAYANFDGVVVKVSISEGDYFEAGKSVMTVIDDSRYKATVEVDEIDVQLLEKGMTASLTSDAIAGTSFQGYISYIPMIGRYTNTGIGVMDVEIIIDNPPKSLKPGFSFEGVIEVESEQSMLLVSQSAVTIKRGVSTVTKETEDGKLETVNVQVKYLGENLYQIVSGNVKDGDTVVYSRSGSGFDGLFGGGGVGSGMQMPSGGTGDGMRP